MKLTWKKEILNRKFFIFNLTFVFFFSIETKYKASSCVYLFILFDNAKISITDVLHTVDDLLLWALLKLFILKCQTVTSLLSLELNCLWRKLHSETLS